MNRSDVSKPARDRVRAAHIHGSEDKRARKQKQMAAIWAPDAGLERLLALKTSDPAAYDRVPGLVKASLGHYLRYREAAEAEGIDVTGGNP